MRSGGDAAAASCFSSDWMMSGSQNSMALEPTFFKPHTKVTHQTWGLREHGKHDQPLRAENQ